MQKITVNFQCENYIEKIILYYIEFIFHNLFEDNN